MTRSRRRMLEELQRLNYAATTVRTYLRVLEEFSRHFNQSPHRLGAEEIRQFIEPANRLAGLDEGVTPIHHSGE